MRGTLNWKYNAQDEINGQPVIAADGTIYASSDRVTALNPDGTQKWQFAIHTLLPGLNYDVSGAALGANGRLYFGADDGKVYALDSNGNSVGSFKTLGPVKAAPTLAPDGTLYVGSDDAWVYALTPGLTVKRKWLTLGNVRSSPAIGQNGWVYVGSNDGGLYALNPNSALPAWVFHTIGFVTSSPAVGRDGTVYFGAGDFRLYALNGSTGAKKWSFQTLGPITSSPAIDPNGAIVFGSADGRVYSVKDLTTSASLNWSTDTHAPVKSSPAIGADGTVFIGSDSKSIYALAGDTGQIRWSSPTGGVVRSAPSIGSNGNLYAGSADKYLYAIGPKSVEDCEAQVVSDGAPDGDKLTRSFEAQMMQCLGPAVTFCKASLLGNANFDNRAAAQQYMAKTLSPGQHLALIRDRERKVNAFLKDPTALSAYCNGDADGDLVPDSVDHCPNTPPITPTDAAGCTDPTVPATGPREALDNVLGLMGLAYDKKCTNAPLPAVPIVKNVCERPTSRQFMITFTPASNEPQGCQVWYRVDAQLKFNNNQQPGETLESSNFAIGPGQFSTHSPEPPGLATDVTFDVTTWQHSEVFTTIRLQAVNGNGVPSAWSEPVTFYPKICTSN